MPTDDSLTSATKEARQRFAINLLTTLLPYSLPILRRFQFHLQTEHSEYLTSIDLSTNPITETCFAIAYLDRSRRSETECWFYLSSEEPNHCPSSSPLSTSTCPNCKTAILTLLNKIASLPLPPSIHDNPRQPNSSLTSTLEAHALNHNIMLAGSVHSKITSIINEAGFGMTEMPGHNLQYTKYIFDLDGLPGDETLPAGLRWGFVRDQDFELVRSRTSIPRKNATLKILPSIAIFPEDGGGGGGGGRIDSAPIAWAFLGVDFSLTSLHVEPDFRGRGLAKKVAAKIWRENLSSLPTVPMTVQSATGEVSQRAGRNYGHADVAIDNAESNGVCRSLGGRASWTVYWLRIDLAAVRRHALDNPIRID